MYQFPLRHNPRSQTDEDAAPAAPAAFAADDDDNNKRQRSTKRTIFNFIFIALLCIKYLQLFAMRPGKMSIERAEKRHFPRLDAACNADKFK